MVLGAPLAACRRIDVEPLSLTDFRSDGHRWMLRSSGVPVAAKAARSQSGKAGPDIGRRAAPELSGVMFADPRAATQNSRQSPKWRKSML
ncbi:hypothetical protein [Mesorhizobium sp. M0771]|uniref:hypothetical protein n=1 Tax=Mesorhizobium sp. M0771 TaxID=2956997 RepID=UPI0033352FD1